MRRWMDSGVMDAEGTIGHTVLVTGAGGFIGGHCCRWLHRAGYEVRALAREPDRARKALPGIPVFECRLPDRIDPAAFTPGASLVHCAYDFLARDAIGANVQGADALLRLCRE